MPRIGLTTASVVSTAIAVIDSAGATTLTLSAVAERAGVATPSLYKHVANLAELRRLVAVRVVGELTDRVSRAVMGRQGREAIRAFLLAYRDYVIEHPQRYLAMPQAPNDDPDWMAASERLLAVLYAITSRCGMAETDAVHTIRALRAVAHGFSVLQVSGAFQLAEDIDTTYDRLITTVTALVP